MVSPSGRDVTLEHLERNIAIGLVLGGVIYASISLWSDAEKLLGHAVDFPPWVFLGALVLTLVNYALRFVKWHWYLKYLDISVPWTESATAFVAGMVMAVTPGKVGEVLKSFLLKESRDISIARTAPIVIAERVTDLLGMIVIAGVGVVIFDYGRAVLVLTLIGILLGLVLLHQRDWMLACLDWIGDLPLVGRFRSGLEEAYESMYELVGWRILGGTTILSVVAWSMEGVALFWILQTLGAGDVNLYMAFFIYSIPTIAGAVSGLPGGLGAAEAVMIGLLFGVFGVFDSKSVATLATYVIRFATLWFGVLLGLVALVYYRTRYGDDASSSSA